jgi:protein SCO1/2
MVPIVWAMTAPRVAPNLPPPVLLRVPAFELTNESGRTLRSSELQSGPWVAAVFFTRCPTVCPALMSELRALEIDTRVGAPGGRFVCFSADPVHDDPAVLTAYRRDRGLEGERWVFLTGEEEDIRSTLLEGLKLGLGEDGEAPFGIFHATSLALIDRNMNVRGYYQADDAEALDQLARDLITLDRLSK